MAYDFSATQRITSKYGGVNSVRSYAMWTRREGNGGNAFGRVFDKRASSGGQTEVINNDTGSGNYAFSHQWTSGQARWDFARPAANEWHHVLVTYNNGATTNNPIIYVDGVSVTVTQFTADPTGSPVTTTDAFEIGNTSVADRFWDGQLCDFAIWNRILTAKEATSIGADKFSPLFYPKDLVLYMPLIRSLVDYKNRAGTNSSAVVYRHPRIIYPRNFR